MKSLIALIFISQVSHAMPHGDARDSNLAADKRGFAVLDGMMAKQEQQKQYLNWLATGTRNIPQIFSGASTLGAFKNHETVMAELKSVGVEVTHELPVPGRAMAVILSRYAATERSHQTSLVMAKQKALNEAGLRAHRSLEKLEESIRAMNATYR